MYTQSEIARHYSRMEIETSASRRIIWKLHAKAVQLLNQVMETTDLIRRRRLLDIVQNILAQLEISLKVTDEVSQSLNYLYDYCYCLLETDKEDNFTSAVRILTLLRDTYFTLLRR